MSRTLQRAILIVAILGIAVAIAAGLSQMKPPPEKKAVEADDLLVETLPLSSGTAQFTIASQGTVRPRTETQLSAEVAGSIVSISPGFVAGGFFAAGEELLRIDPEPYEAAVEQAQAVLQQRQIEYDGAESLRSKGYRAEAELAAASAALATARAALINARRDLAKTRIRLPYAGMVRRKGADLGQFVNPGSSLGVVFATDYAEVRLPLTDHDLAFVNLPLVTRKGAVDGPAVTFTATQRGRSRAWQGHITRTEGVVDESTRVTWMVARIDDPYQLQAAGDATVLPMGSFVNAAIEGRSIDDVIRVPRTALRGGNELLIVDDDDRIRIRAVDVLRANADHAWIESGVEAGERISLTPIESPINGMKVRTARPAGNDTVAKADN